MNSVFNSLLATEQYLITWKENIEADLGGDVLGVEGELDIVIPEARYAGYHLATAWDSNLLEENIVDGVTIFGVTGSMTPGGGPVAITPPTLAIDAARPLIGVPTLVVV